uniref:SAP domain-containing ribonucleoprotein n=1 Tax=Pongo abelii TaxID=9601 RepID=A0A8I5T2Q8_PONAB
MVTEMVELHQLKLAELKQECLACGLETKGIKQDLIHRLQTYLEEHKRKKKHSLSFPQSECAGIQWAPGTSCSDETRNSPAPAARLN